MNALQSNILRIHFIVLLSFALTLKAENKCSSGKSNSTGPHCGLYCLYSTIRLFDRDIDFRNLLKPGYLGSRKGSSLAELKRAAIDHNLYAETVGNLSDKELKTAATPVILHVKSSMESKEYDHYILFLGDKDGKAKIFDPPNPVELKPYYELAPIWDGKGLIVSAEPLNLSKIFAPTRKKFAFFAAIAIAVILMVRFCRTKITAWVSAHPTLDSRLRGNDNRRGNDKRKLYFSFSIAQAAGLLIIALLGGMMFHFTTDAGFLARAGTTESIVKANIEDFIPKINADDVKNMINSGAVIIDARQSADFDAGHIKNAINIPTTLCQKGRESKLAGVDKNAQIVIYCQSKGCPYAANVATNLYDDGFKNISIYKNGWIEWENKKDTD